MIYEHEYMRVEFDWLASDQDDFVAYISSAGAGPLPKAAIEAAPLLEDVLDRIRGLTRTGKAIPTAGVLNPRDWLDVAERGFFAYDWSSTSKRYELIAEPSRPLHLHGIPKAELRLLAARIRLPIRLSGAPYIPADLDID